MHRWWRICLSHLICLCGGGGGPFVFKIRNLSHNCRPKIEIWNCWHHQKKHSSHIASQTSFKSTMIYLLSYGCIFNSVTRNQCSSVRNQEWDCGFLFPKMLGIFFKNFISVCVLISCAQYMYIFIWVLYTSIWVYMWVHGLTACAHVCTWMWRLEADVLYHPWLILNLCFQTVSLTESLVYWFI